MDTHPIKLLFADRAEYQAFQNGEDASIVVIVGLYGVILAALGAVWFAPQFPLPVTVLVYAAAFLVIGWAQYSLGNGMHEAVHYNLRNKKGDGWASIFTAYPIGLTMKYRETHLKHHRHIGTDQDPEFHLYNTFPASRWALIRRFFWFASGIPALIQFTELRKLSAKTLPTRRSRLEPFAFLATQAVILAAFWIVFGNPLYYVFFWGVPIATVGKLLSSTRLLCEHGSPEANWVVRTIDGPRWQTWLMGAFDFNYHAEHHLFPSVPYANLKKLYHRNRKYAAANPSYRPFDGRLEFYSGGYLKLLASWFRALPWTRRQAQA